jgi:hypothetical protein
VTGRGPRDGMAVMTPAEPGGTPRTWHPGFLADWEIRKELDDPATAAARRSGLLAVEADRRRVRAEASAREREARLAALPHELAS